MPAIQLPDELLALVRKTNLVPEDRLAAFLAARRAAQDLPDTANALATLLVRDGLLTAFQARRLLAGKARGLVLGGKYKLLDEIGAGGMGKVYLGEHTRLQRLIAVKVLPPGQQENPAALERFEREARAAAALDHPNIVRLYDIDQDGKVHFMVMEFVDGVDLQRLVDARGPLDPVRAAHYLAQAALGLQHAHEAGLVHRDVKPGNLLLDRGGTVKLLDLGLARFFDREGDNITQQFDEKAVLGTADFIAPEQAMASSAVDIRADVYALGATGYSLLTGQPPFAGGSTAQKLLAHQMKEPPPLHAQWAHVPPELEAVLRRMLAKNPADRYQDPIAVVEALAPWTAEPLPPPDPATLPQPPSVVRRLSGAATPSGGGLATASGTRLPRVGSGASRLSLPPVARTPRPSGPATPVPPAPAAVPAEPARPPRNPWRTVALVLALAVLGGVGVGVYLVTAEARPVASGPAAATATAPATNPAAAEEPFRAPLGRLPLLVCKVPDAGGTGQPNIFPSLRAALAHAQPGDLIRVTDQTVEEVLDVAGAHLDRMAIQAFPKAGTKVVWRPPAGAEAGRPLLRVRGVAGLRLHGFTFDGENRVDDLIHLDGVGAGVRLERLELAGFNRYGVRLTGAGGTAAAPVVLRHLRFTSEARAATAGVGFDPPAAHHVHVAHCRFEGPCTAGLLLRGPAPDLEVRLTRFYDLQYGLLYARAEPPAPVRWALVNNTFARIQDGALQFEAVPPAGADAAIDLRRNLFFQVRAVALVGRAVNGQLVNDGPVDEGRLKDLFGFPAVQEQGNVRDRFANENEGYTWLAGRRDVDPLGFNKLADGQFLRYGRDSALMTAAGGQAVGVPPE